MSIIAARSRRAMRFAAVFLTLLCISLAARAQADDPWVPFLTPWFEHVGASDGLPHSVTTAVAQDRRGLVWIGTMGGLARFDGYRMQVFDADRPGADALPDAYVRSLLALPDGGVLVGTNSGGLSRFEPATNHFHTYPIGSGGTTGRKIYALAADHDKGVWIATDRGLDYLDLASDTLRAVATGAATTPLNFSVLQDRAGNVWLGNDNGLFVRRAGSRVFARLRLPHNPAAAVLNSQIWAIHEDRAGRLWIGSGQDGAAYRDTDGRWKPVPGFSGDTQDAHHATVRAFVTGTHGMMWIGTDGSGVVSYRAGDAQTHAIAHDDALPSSLPGNSVRALMRDRTGNLWVATDLGAAHTNTQARTVCSLLPSPLDIRGLANNNVHAIHVDSRQRIWLGLGRGRIDLITLADGRMQHLAMNGPQSDRDVRAFAETPDGTIWVGSQGLARIDPDTLTIHADAVPPLDGKPVLSLRQVKGQLLIGTYEGVYRYNLSSGALSHFRHDPSDPRSLASDTVRQIALVGDQVWYGTAHGISIADSPAASGGFHNLEHVPGDPTSLPQDYIGSITPDGRGRLWVATFGGLAVLDHLNAPGPYRFRTIGTADGLSSDKINAVLPDDRGNIWLSTSNGISMIDGTRGTIYNVGTRDGLHVPSYIYVAAARAPTGELMFGGLGGLTVVRRPLPADAPAEDAVLTITNARVGGVTLPFGMLPKADAGVTLQGHSSSLQVGFALLDYRAPQETLYAYRMDGFDDGWNQIPPGSPPRAVYTNLPHGRYTLRLRATTRGMRPQAVETSLPIEVEPRWYETIGFRLAVLLLSIGLVAALVHLRTLYLRRQAHRLQQLVDERTSELQAANARLDELAGTDELTGVYNRRRFLELAEGVREISHDGAACLAVLDLDHFKRINDSYGHLAGDAVIRAAIAVILQHCERSDLVGRYGGEELVICMPDRGLQQAFAMAERIRRALADTVVEHGPHTIRFTTSIGVAAIVRRESIEQWLSRADAALYDAKRSGRNRCVMAASQDRDNTPESSDVAG